MRVIFRLVALLFSTLVFAQDASLPDAPDVAATCRACHGVRGISPTPKWPSLGGQPASYLVRQLEDYRSGLRRHPIMAPLAEPLTDEDIATLAAYFDRLPLPKPEEGRDQSAAKLYLEGDGARGIPACAACHGQEGEGNGEMASPALRGQGTAYLKEQLLAYRAGSRGNDRGGLMKQAVEKLRFSEIMALVAYIGREEDGRQRLLEARQKQDPKN